MKNIFQNLLAICRDPKQGQNLTIWGGGGASCCSQSFPCCFQVTLKSGSKKRFVWKQVNVEKDPHCEVEVNFLSELKHPGIVELLEVQAQNGVVDMILELCTQDMQHFIAYRVESYSYKVKLYTRPQLWQIASAMEQLLSTVNFLHENCVAHRDIKPENVLQASGHLDLWKF